MKFNDSDLEILNRLVGQVSENTAESMCQNLECFLHPKVSIFIPSCGRCPYAVTPGHTHPAYTFIYYFQPVADFIVEGSHISYDPISGKCLSAMAPGIHHQEIEEEYVQSYIAIAIQADFFQEIAMKYVSSIPVFRGESFVPHPELLGLLRCFMLESNEHKDEEVLAQLASVITHMVVRSTILKPEKAVPLYDRFEVDKAIAFMNSHFSEKITIMDIAGQVNISAGHFTKIFKSITGETPIDFLNLLRLQKSRVMLRNNAGNITDIALKCGFNSSSYFSTCFLKKYKLTPSAYRKRHVKE